MLAEDGAQGGLRQLAGCGIELLDLNDRLFGIDDAVIDDGVDPHRDVIARDHVLRGNVQKPGPQIHAHHLLDNRNNDERGLVL